MLSILPNARSVKCFSEKSFHTGCPTMLDTPLFFFMPFIGHPLTKLFQGLNTGIDLKVYS